MDMELVTIQGSQEPNRNETEDVVLVVEHAKETEEPKEEMYDYGEEKLKSKPMRLWRIGAMVFIICLVDMITLYYMNDIYSRAGVSGNCGYLSNLLYVIVPVLCLLATAILAGSAYNLYFRQNDKGTVKTMAIAIYLAAIILHSVLFWYENILLSDMESNMNSAATNCGIAIGGNLTMIRYALTIKGILFTVAFVVTFIYNLFLRLISSSRRCILMTMFSIAMLLFICMVLFITDSYRYNGVHIHSIAAVFGLLQLKCAGGAAHGGGSTSMNAHRLSTTYVHNAKTLGTCCPKACKAGFCCCNGCNGCCECQCKSGACCVVFTWNVFKCRCGSDGSYPDSLCCSFCGLYTCFCCDPGGCCGYCCYSIDVYSWC